VLKKEQLFSQRTGGVFSVTLSVVAIFQLRRPRILRGMLPYGVRTFLQQIPSIGTHQRSSAIGKEYITIRKAGNAFAPQALWSAVS
jgi:hypothetical protein